MRRGSQLGKKGRTRQEHRIQRRCEGGAVQPLLLVKLVIQLLPQRNFQ
jgi:hypothetical protein